MHELSIGPRFLKCLLLQYPIPTVVLVVRCRPVSLGQTLRVPTEGSLEVSTEGPRDETNDLTVSQIRA